VTFFFKFVKIRKNLEEIIMDNKLDIIEKQKLIQSLKLSQIMKLSINILKMSITELNNFIEKEISKQTADFDEDKFYERSFLLDWNSFIPKGRNSNFLPSSYSYTKHGVKYKTLIIWKAYTEYGMDKLLQSSAEGGEMGGQSYKKDDTGKKLLVAGYKYDENGCLVSSIEPILYGEGGQMET